MPRRAEKLVRASHLRASVLPDCSARCLVRLLDAEEKPQREQPLRVAFTFSAIWRAASDAASAGRARKIKRQLRKTLRKNVSDICSGLASSAN